MNIYGYCRVSTKHQSLDRQEKNILNKYENAIIIKETFTGTNHSKRTKLLNLVKKLSSNDKLVLDSITRLSRNAKEGFELYQRLTNLGVSIEFLNEPHLNSDLFHIETSDTMHELAQELYTSLLRAQIKIAFEHSEQEAKDTRRAIKQGIELAKIQGKRIGMPKGSKNETNKARASKEQILKHNRSFGGSLSDIDTMKLLGIARNTFYKYKKELIESEQQQ